MTDIRVKCALTERQYRDYMKFHVLGNHTDLRRHIILCVLIAAFGAVNFAAGSPVLGWIFATLALYVFVSRFLRFYMSVNRIVEQFGLGEEPKDFYTVTFHSGDFEVDNQKEHARYPYSRIVRVCFREENAILYLYLTSSNAFLIPFGGFESGSVEALKELLQKKVSADAWK